MIVRLWVNKMCLVKLSRENLLRRGVSKIGLAVVLAVIAILIALLIPAVRKTQEAAARTACVNNLKQMCLCVHGFESTFKRIPPLYGGSVIGTQYQASLRFPEVWGSTHVFILPYVEASPDYASMRTGNPPNVLPSLAIGKAMATYVCPSDPSISMSLESGGTSYAANAQVFAPLRDETLTGAGEMYGMTQSNYCDRRTPIDGIKDGSSNTIGFVHSYSLCGSSALSLVA